MKDDSKLPYIWSRQKEFNQNFVDFDKLDNLERQQWTKEYVLHLNSEVQDLLDEVNWKMHHKKDIRVNRRDLILEWIDVFKYWLSIGLVWGITPDEFVDAFVEKSDLVEQRFLQEFSDIKGQKVAVVDIDGVLGDYPETFLKYIDYHEGTHLKDTCVTNLNLYEMFEKDISTSKMKEYKYSYRTDGTIRTEKVSEGAVEFLKLLKDKGYYVVLLTSRPFDKYNNLYLDTYMWLKSNDLTFDMLLNDGKKRDKIISLSQSSSIKFIVDDDPKIISGLLGLEGIDTIYMIDKPYNQEMDSSRVVRVKDFKEIVEKENL